MPSPSALPASESVNLRAVKALASLAMGVISVRGEIQ